MTGSGRVDRAAGWGTRALLVAFVAFFVLPFAGLIYRAFSEDGSWDVLGRSEARSALVLSLWTSTLATAVVVLVGTPVAYTLARGRFRGRAALDTLVDLPVVLPPTVAGVALLAAFGRRGLLGEPLESWTGITLSFTTAAVVIAQVLVGGPFFVRAAASGFARLDEREVGVAYTLGASRLRVFWSLAVPHARAAILAGVVLCWSRALGELGATLVFAGNFEGRTRTMPLAIVSVFEGTSGGLGAAIGLSLLLLAAALVALILFRLVAGRIEAGR